MESKIVINSMFVYLIAWIVMFFFTLPFGLIIERHPKKGNADSAPKKTRLSLKVLITSLLSAIITYFIMDHADALRHMLRVYVMNSSL